MWGDAVRSVRYLSAAALLTGCAWTGTPESAGKPAPARDATALRVPATDSPTAANLARRATDDEQAVDARELTRRAAPAPSSAPAKTGANANAPRINVLYVSNGRIRAYGPAIWIRGTVESPLDGTEVSVNGQRAQVKDRSFQRRIAVPPGESEVIVRAEDIAGNVTTTRFILTRSGPSQSLPAARPPAETGSTDLRMSDPTTLDRVPRIEDVTAPGVYMILMAGTPAAHFVKMPNLAQCREAVEYTENAACTVHKGRD